MKMLLSGIERGVKFEITYAPGMFTTDGNARRNMINNATQLIRATRGRGLIISSGATRASACRAPADLINLAAVWGLGQERGKEAISKLPRSVVIHAQMSRTSFKGIVDVVYGGEKAQVPEKAKKTSVNDRKRNADNMEGGNTDGLLPMKPMSKREQKRQRKAALHVQQNQAP